MTGRAFTIGAMCDALERAVARLDPRNEPGEGAIKLRPAERGYEASILRAIGRLLTAATCNDGRGNERAENVYR